MQEGVTGSRGDPKAHPACRMHPPPSCTPGCCSRIPTIMNPLAWDPHPPSDTLKLCSGPPPTLLHSQALSMIPTQLPSAPGL